MPPETDFYTNDDGIPNADGFDFPVGPRGDDVDVFKTHKIDVTLADAQYKDNFGVWHPGEDWNGKGGGDSDLGHPIYAIAHGRVAESGYYTPSWGNIVLLEHAMPDGSTVWSQYAHLNEIMVDGPGAQVKRGQQIGTMGKGAKSERYPDGRWTAHLHFEIRKERLPINMWRPLVSSREEVLANYCSPRQFIEANRPSGFPKYKPPRRTPRPEPEPLAPQPEQVPEMLPPAAIGRWPGDPAGYAENVYEANPDRPFYDGVDVYGKPFRYKLTAPTHDVTVGYHVYLPAAGRYAIEVFIPAQYARERRAGYFITLYMNGGQTVRRVEVDQSIYWNEWVSLGEYDLDPERPGDGLVNVADQSYEIPPQLIAFAGVRWRRVDA